MFAALFTSFLLHDMSPVYEESGLCFSVSASCACPREIELLMIQVTHSLEFTIGVKG